MLRGGVIKGTRRVNPALLDIQQFSRFPQVDAFKTDRIPGPQLPQRGQVSCDHIGDFGITSRGLLLDEKDHRLSPGRYLNAAQRDSFADQFGCRARPQHGTRETNTHAVGVRGHGVIGAIKSNDTVRREPFALWSFRHPKEFPARDPRNQFRTQRVAWRRGRFFADFQTIPSTQRPSVDSSQAADDIGAPAAQDQGDADAATHAQVTARAAVLRLRPSEREQLARQNLTRCP